MQQALDALKTCGYDFDREESIYKTYDAYQIDLAIAALEAELAKPEQNYENTSIKTISNAIDYLYSTGGEAKNIANQAHTALKQLQINLRDQTALHLLYKGDYEDLRAQPEQEPTLFFGRAVYFADPKIGDNHD